MTSCTYCDREAGKRYWISFMGTVQCARRLCRIRTGHLWPWLSRWRRNMTSREKYLVRVGVVVGAACGVVIGGCATAIVFLLQL